ncbi:MAG: aminopeptidase P family protein [Proteobacteria bacterium]|nr:aminopeptidase P family protein [Pseudomonadota bacterium]
MKNQARVHFSDSKRAALKARRDRIGLALQSGILIAASRPPMHRYDGSYFRYRQDPNFYYLSGLFSEDQGVLVLYAVYPLHELSKKLPELMQNATTIYTDRQNHKGIDRILEDIVFKQRLPYDGVEIRDYWGFIGDFRLIKDEFEIDLMQTANRISAAAHQRCMQDAHAGMTELELQALLELEMKTGGAPLTAYHSIVASGSNSCCLHYNINSCTLEAGDLVLIDAGCAFEGYASDITRTWPVDGKFTKEQKIIYDIVLATHKKIIDMVRPGARIPDLQDATIRELSQGLIDAGILSISLEEALAKDTFKEWYPHGVSHWLGLNVHDAGRYLVDGQRRPLEPGMVITVEPGIYIQPGSPFTAEVWHGIGVRIEDDILVTSSGSRNLTQCAKEVAELEALRTHQL